MHQYPPYSEQGRIVSEICLMVCLMEIPRDQALGSEAAGFLQHLFGEPERAGSKAWAPGADAANPAGADREARTER